MWCRTACGRNVAGGFVIDKQEFAKIFFVPLDSHISPCYIYYDRRTTIDDTTTDDVTTSDITTGVYERISTRKREEASWLVSAVM